MQQSEQRQRAILDNIPDPAWLKDKAGRYLAVNPAWCRFIGMNADDAKGKTAFEVFPPEVAQKLSEQDRIILQTRQSLHYEELLTGKDGRPVWFETIKSPLFNDHGDVVGTTGLARNITDREKRPDEALRPRCEASLREAQEVACLGFTLLISPKGIGPVRKSSTGFSIFHPIMCGSVEGWDNLVHPDERQLMLDYFRNEVLGSTNPLTGSTESFATATPSSMGSRTRATRVRCRGRPTGMLGTIQDITERKRLEQEKLEMERRLLHAQKLESLGILAGGIAHDFNNILAGIMGYADLARCLCLLPNRHARPRRDREGRRNVPPT